MSLPSITEREVHIAAQGPPVSEMTYTMLSRTLNSTNPYLSLCLFYNIIR